MHRKEPCKNKFAPQIGEIWESRFGLCFVLNNIWTRSFNRNMAGQKSPKRAGRNLGVQVWTLAGQSFLQGSSRGWAPQALGSQDAPQKEPSCPISSYLAKNSSYLAKYQVTWQNQVTYRRISNYFDRNNIKSPGSAEVQHYLAFWVSFLQYQNSIDYLVHHVFFATSRWKDTH